MHRGRNTAPLLSPARGPLRRAQSGMAPSHIPTSVCFASLSGERGLNKVILAAKPANRCEIADNKTVTSITSRIVGAPDVAPEAGSRTVASLGAC
jgi:hypothetical protein